MRLIRKYYIHERIEKKVLMFENVHFGKIFHFPMDHQIYGTLVTAE